MVILRETSWQLEEAISLFFAPKPTSPYINTDASYRRKTSSDADSTGQETTNVTGDIPSWLNVSIFGPFGGPSLSSIVKFLLRTTWHITTGVASFLVSFLFPSSSPLHDFSTSFESKFGTNHPNFFSGTFRQGILEARKKQTGLVIFLHSEYSIGSDTFCRNVLSDERVIEFVNRDYIVWGTSFDTREAFEVGRFLRIRMQPHVSVVLPTGPDEMRQIGVAEGAITIDQFVSMLTSCMSKIEENRIEVLAVAEMRDFDRQIREEQDRDYLESLRKDAERETEEKAIREKILLEEEKIRRKEERNKEKESCFEVVKRGRLDGAEKWKQKMAKLEAVSLPNSSAKICLKLPNGVRLEQSFDHQEPLQSLYDWAECCEEIYSEITPKLNISIPRKFTLSLPSPCKVLDQMTATFEELGLVPNSVVLLTEVDDSDSEAESDR